MKKWGHSNLRLEQSKNKTPEDKHQTLQLYVGHLRLLWWFLISGAWEALTLQFCCLEHT